MKKDEIPQDESALNDFTREVCYAQNEKGKYETGLSKGWDVKKEALDLAWKDIEENIEQAKQAVLNGEKSPVFYFKEVKLMDMQTLSGYTGFWKITIKRHMKPSVFNKLNDKKLSSYAKAFDVTIQNLKNFTNYFE